MKQFVISEKRLSGYRLGEDYVACDRITNTSGVRVDL